ncbi:MAG: hypothetical protein WCR78_05500 [Arcobacteraceae bacterium]
MINITFKQNLFNKHIEKIEKSLKEEIEVILQRNLSRDEKKCIKYIEKNLNSILKANNKELIKIIKDFETKYPDSIGKHNQKKDDWKPLYKLIREDLFEKEYNNWGQRKKYGSYTFVNDMDLKTCPYCNRNYIFIVDENTGKLRPEIDHFYPKSIYPFLAMSFYNLIPSCPTCNHTKKDKNSLNIKLKNPYDIKSNDYQFTIEPNNIDFANIDSKYNYDNFEISINNKDSNIEIFKLEELYKQHKDIVLDLIIKKIHYPKSYIDELSSFGFDKDEIYRYLLCNYSKDEDLHKRPLSKLIKDISEELKIFA